MKENKYNNMVNSTNDDFIFITEGMIDKMKQGCMKNTVNGHMDSYKRDLGQDHVHIIKGDVIVWTDDLIEYYCGITNGWSESGIQPFEDESDGIIAFCNITNYFNNQPHYCLYAIRDFMIEFVKVGGLVMLNGIVYNDSNVLEDYINKNYI